MNKKSLFGLFAMGTVLFAASCQEEDVVQQVVGNGPATVSVNVTTPELGGTRAFGDGTTAQTLHYAVYNVKSDEAGNETRTYLKDLTVEDHTFEISTTVDLQLVTGNTYDVIFWADSDDDDLPYTVNWTDTTTGAANATISVNYADVTSNNEAYDAFFNWMRIVVKGSQTESIKLYRPFGQLNIGTNDLKKAASAGYEVKETQVTVATYNTLDLWTKEVSGEETVEFAWAAFPDSTKETFPVKVEAGQLPYYYLAMNYLLLPTDKKLVDVTFDYTDSLDDKQRLFSAVPVRRNWRTNIYGQLLTSDVDVNVEIVPLFEDEAVHPDSVYNREVWDGKTLTKPGMDEDGNVVIFHGDELAYFANMINGGGQSNAAHAPATRGEEDTFDYYTATIKLMNNIDLGGENWAPINGVKYINAKGQEALKCFTGTFDGNGHTVSNLYVRAEGKASAGLFAAARNVKNLTVKDADIKGQYKAGVIAGDGLCGKFENCHVENAVVVSTPYNNNDANNVGGIVGYLSAEPTAYVKNCSVKNAEITAYRKVGGIVGAANGASVVTGNSVENVTVTADQSAEYSEDKPFDAGDIVGYAHANATVENNTTGEGVEVITVIKDADTFLSQVQVEGANVNLVAGTYTFPGSKIAAGVTINCEEGTVFEGTSKLNINGATVIGATFSNPTGTAADQTINGTFKDCTFEGVNGLRWAYAGETCVFENCVFSGSTYGAHFDGGANDILFKNCTFSGFNAFGGAVELVTFDNCVFKSNGKSSYNGANLWGSTTMINTKFEFDGSAATEWIDCIGTDKTYEFTGCTLNGGSIFNSEYISSRNVGTRITIDGVAYTWAEGGYLVREEDGIAVVATAGDLADALAAGADVTMTQDLADVAVSTKAPYGNSYGVAQNGGVFDGEGHILDFDAPTGDNYGIMTSGGTIKNVTIGGVFRGIMIMNPTEDLSIDNVTIGGEDVCYSINTGEGDGTHSLYVSNSTIKGWNSYGTAIKDVTFTNCTFAQGEYYTNVYGRLAKPYVDATFENCEFCSKYYIDLSQFGKDGDGKVLKEEVKLVLKNCTVNGVKLTKDNWESLIVAEGECGEGQISIELKDGSYLATGNVVDYIVFE